MEQLTVVPRNRDTMSNDSELITVGSPITFLKHTSNVTTRDESDTILGGSIFKWS